MGEMLGDIDAVATIPVKDIKTARKFYEGILGLTPLPSQQSSVLMYRTGESKVLVYQSQYAGTNQATAVTWGLGSGDEVEPLVNALKAKGVVFEHYDFPGLTRKGDVHVAGKLKNAWFKDPDGNIHSIVGQ
jgi:catechol 2,3-dioxygenase-like lactoylglutathione lyase family enzyme